MASGEKWSSKCCLFCMSTDPQKFAIGSGTRVVGENGATVVIKEEEITRAFGDWSSLVSSALPEIGYLVQDQLKVVFVLRKLLELPAEKLANYLQLNDGAENPLMWFSICTCCIKIVEEGYKVYCKIARLQKTLTEIKDNLKSLILAEPTRKRKTRNSLRGSEISNVCQDIREYILSESTLISDGCAAEKKIWTRSDSRRKATATEVLLEPLPFGLPNVTNINVEFSDDIDNVLTTQEPSDVHEEENKDEGDICIDNDDDWLPSNNSDDTELELAVKERSTFPKKRKLHLKKKCSPRKILTQADHMPTTDSLEKDDKVIIQEVDTKIKLPTRKKIKLKYLQNCDLCVASYLSKEELRNHKKLHENNEGKPCPHCGWLCKENGVTIHIGIRHKSQQQHFRRNFRRTHHPMRKQLKYDYKRITRVDTPYYCDYCHMIFTSKGLVLKHLQLYHPEARSIACAFCNSSGFETKQLLELHTREEHPTETIVSTMKETQDEPLICSHCPNSFSSKLSRDYHIAKYHKDKLLTCEICGHKANKFTYLMVHKKIKHLDEKFVCDKCPKSFNRKWNLETHMKTVHTVDFRLGTDPMVPSCSGNSKFTLKQRATTQKKRKVQLKRKRNKLTKLKREDLTPTAESLAKEEETEGMDTKTLGPSNDHEEEKDEGDFCIDNDSDWLPSSSDNSELAVTQSALTQKKRKVYSKRKRNKRTKLTLEEFTPAEESLTKEEKDETEGMGTKTPVPSNDHEEENKDEGDFCIDNDSDWLSSDSDDSKLAVKQRTGAQKKRKVLSKRKRNKQTKLTLEELTPAAESLVKEEDETEGIDTKIKLPTRKKLKLKYLQNCDLCVASYLSKKELVNHKKLHESNEGKPCPHCGWLCKENGVILHIAMRHKSQQQSRRNFLRTRHTKRKQLKYDYKRITRVDRPYYCDYCHMMFTSQRIVLEHISLYHPEARSSTCPFCNSSTGFETKQLLELHIKDEHPTETFVSTVEETQDEPLRCSHCSRLFLSKLSRDYHIAKHHKDKLLTCEICGYKTKKFSYYRRHKKIKHENEKYLCEKCPKTFNTNSYLTSHMKMVHGVGLGIGSDPVVCTICNAKFLRSSALSTHMKYVHQKIKDQFCEHCGKAFSRLADLAKHILLHTAPREKQYKQGPFFCEFCQAKFNVRQALYYHLKKLHSDKYAYTCENCGTGYMSPNTLNHHKLKCKGTLLEPPSLPSSSNTATVECATVTIEAKSSCDNVVCPSTL